MDWSGLERDKLFISKGTSGYQDLSYLSGLDSAQDGRAYAYADLDHDGAIDLIVLNRDAPILQIFRNRIPQSNWISLQLAGDSRKSNPSAVGAMVTAVCGDHKVTRCVEAGTGFGVQNTMTLQIGLDTCQKANKIMVRWPDGTEQEFQDVQSKALYHLSEGGTLEAVPGFYQSAAGNQATNTATATSK